MEFLNPLMLWSALAVSIPIVLHFWHQKKGKLLNWAATQWLTEKDLQPSKGVRLDNVLLLITRCLLILIIAFLLADPLLHWLNGNAGSQKIHLVQPNSSVVNNFRFEIEEALKKGEKVYWIGHQTAPLQDLTQVPVLEESLPPGLQTCINKVYALHHQAGKLQYELYLVNRQSLSQMPDIFLPGQWNLHAVIDSTQKLPRPFLELANKKKLFVNALNQLTVVENLPANEKFDARPVHTGALNVLIEKEDKAEKQTILAALKALTEVYQIEFSTDERVKPEKQYDWVFTDTKTVNDEKAFSAKTLFLFSNEKTVQNITRRRYSPEIVANGQLPEWLGEQLVNGYQLNVPQKPLSNQQLNALFKTPQEASQLQKNTNEETWFSKSVLLFFVIVVGIERWLAIRKNA